MIILRISCYFMNIEIELLKGNIYNFLIDIYLFVVNKIDIYIKYM